MKSTLLTLGILFSFGAASAQRLIFSDTLTNIGTVQDGDSVKLKVKVTNPTKYEIRFRMGQTCSYTRMDTTEVVLPPNSTLAIPYFFKTQGLSYIDTGNITKGVFCDWQYWLNDSESIYQHQLLQIKAKVKPAKDQLIDPNKPVVCSKFSEVYHRFGTVPMGPKAAYTFTFKNCGIAPFTVQSARASCGCTTPQWTKETLMPGQSGIIMVEYGTEGRPGFFNKTVTVVFDNGSSQILTIEGTVATDTGTPKGPEIGH